DGIRDFHVTGVQTCALPIYGMLVFLKSGFATQEIHVNNQKQLDVKMLVASPETEAAEAEGAEQTDSSATQTDSTTVLQDSSQVQTDSTQTAVVTDSTVQSDPTVAAPSGQNVVTGTVNGPSGPLPGITVKVVGTDLSASTDENGKFQIAADAKSRLR